MTEFETDLYVTTAEKTRVELNPRQLNRYLDTNLKREIEKKYANKFFSYGYVRPGTIKILSRSIGNNNGASDFSGKKYFDVIFKCDTFLPQVGQSIVARVKSINRVGILGTTENNKVIVMLTKDTQTTPNMFEDVRLNNRVRVQILSHRIDSQAGAIIVMGDLEEIMEKIYQSYQLPNLDLEGMTTNLRGQIEYTDQLNTLFLNYENWQAMKNSKGQIDPYYVPNFKDLDQKALAKTPNQVYKHSWTLARSLIEDYELVHPKNYNKNKGVAIVPFKATAITRAYFNLWEILNRYKNVVNNLDADKSLTVLALAEGPGGFIQSFSHYRRVNFQSPPDTIFGYTLDTQIKHLRWDWDLAKKELEKLGQNLKLHYLNLMTKEAPLKIQIDMEKAKAGKADLILADGAIEDEGNTSYVEAMNYRLFLGEIVTALLNNKVGGNFVLKVFDLLTKVTYQMVKLLCYYYDEVHVTKPNFSRPASSEKYIICLGFRGYVEEEQENKMTKLLIHVLNQVEKTAPKKTQENEKFLSNLFNILIGEEDSDEVRQKLLEINNDHLQMQNNFINKGVHLIHTQKVSDKKEIKVIKEEQLKQAIQWCKNYNMEYRTKVELTEEKTFPGEIVNQQMVNFELDEKPKLLDHFLKSYQHMSFDYMEDLLKSLQKRVDDIFQDEDQLQKFQIKTSFLNPFDINEEYNSKFFTAYEIMNQFPDLSTGSDPSVLYVHQDSRGEVLRGINHYMQSKTIKFSWYTSTQPPDSQTIPPFYEKYHKTKQWVFSKANQSIDFADSDFVKKATLPEKANLIWMDEEFPNESEFESFPSIYGQVLVGLNNLQKGGHLVVKQWTFFRKISRSFMALMMVLFKDVSIIKPLASPKHSSEVYLVCRSFQASKLSAKFLKELMNFQDDLAEYVNNDDPLKLGGHLPNLMDVNLTDQLENLFRYYCHHLIILNLIPKILIDVDINENPVYSLEKTEQDTLEVLQARQKDVKELPSEAAQNKELEQIYVQIEKLFKNINKKIQSDFDYLVNLKKVWDKANPMAEIKTNQEL